MGCVEKKNMKESHHISLNWKKVGSHGKFWQKSYLSLQTFVVLIERTISFFSSNYNNKYILFEHEMRNPNKFL